MHNAQCSSVSVGRWLSWVANGMNLHIYDCHKHDSYYIHRAISYLCMQTVRHTTHKVIAGLRRSVSHNPFCGSKLSVLAPGTNMVKTTGHFTNGRGNKLYTVEWTPDNGEVKAVLYWHHGFGEYIDRYDASFQAWIDAGIAVYGFDVHGMGLSEPLDLPSRALVRNFLHMTDDADMFLTQIIKPSVAAKGITAPLFMAGNSLGGLVASYMVLKRPAEFAGLIMQSPAIDVEWTPILRFQAAIGNLLARLVPKAKLVPAVRPQDMSQDPVVVQEYLDDPMIYHGNVKALSGNEILKGFRGLVSRRSEFKLPIFAVHGTMDRCTSLPALREHLKHVSSTDVTLLEIKGGHHELLLGPEKGDIRASIRDWMLTRSSPKAEPAVAPEGCVGGEQKAADGSDAVACEAKL